MSFFLPLSFPLSFLALTTRRPRPAGGAATARRAGTRVGRGDATSGAVSRMRACITTARARRREHVRPALLLLAALAHAHGSA